MDGPRKTHKACAYLCRGNPCSCVLRRRRDDGADSNGKAMPAVLCGAPLIERPAGDCSPASRLWRVTSGGIRTRTRTASSSDET